MPFPRRPLQYQVRTHVIDIPKAGAALFTGGGRCKTLHPFPKSELGGSRRQLFWSISVRQSKSESWSLLLSGKGYGRKRPEFTPSEAATDQGFPVSQLRSRQSLFYSHSDNFASTGKIGLSADILRFPFRQVVFYYIIATLEESVFLF